MREGATREGGGGVVKFLGEAEMQKFINCTLLTISIREEDQRAREGLLFSLKRNQKPCLGMRMSRFFPLMI